VIGMIDYILRTSLENHRAVTIIYQKGNDITQRNITVTGFKKGNVEAFCHLRHDIRIFKKENILAASLLKH
jgi:predicted DNA-binding transcriptional regulator YafY